MVRRVNIRREFARDLDDPVRWPQENCGNEGVERLRAGLDEAIEIVPAFPRSATPSRTKSGDDRGVLRKLLLHKLPHVVWYLADASDRRPDIWLLRFFHARQARPTTAAGLSARRRRRKR